VKNRRNLFIELGLIFRIDFKEIKYLTKIN